MTESPVTFKKEKLSDQKGSIAFIHLNAPKSFNSLTLEMVRLIQGQLNEWREDEDVRLIFMDGEGEKAFCAGGDVKSLYEGKQQGSKGIDNPSAINFFDEEYALDFAIHTFPKTIIVWGHGVLMGGGLGLFTGCTHRIVCENTRSAMPEITIGLFPDVGGSWFLNRSPGKTGLFLGLTGVNINAADAIYSGMANRFITQNFKAELLQTLCALSCADIDNGEVTKVLKHFQQLSQNHLPVSELQQHRTFIESVCDAENLKDIVKQIIEQGSVHESAWLQAAANTLKNGCPTTAHLVFEQLKRARYLSLEAVFDMERKISAQCMRNADFYEGVRALLIDKDKSPKWSHASVAEVSSQEIETYFL